MDGRDFLYSNGTPPRIAFSPDAFTFDIQRFDGTTWTLTQETTDGTTTYKLTAEGKEAISLSASDSSEENYLIVKASTDNNGFQNGDIIQIATDSNINLGNQNLLIDTNTTATLNVLGTLTNNNTRLVAVKGTLNVTGSGKITSSTSDAIPLFVRQYGSCTINDVTIESTQGTALRTYAGTINLNSGTIKANSIGISNSGTVNMNGGAVNALYGVYLNQSSTFTLNDGTVSTTQSGGMGVYMAQATGSDDPTDYSAKNGTPNNFVMNGGTIEAKWESGDLTYTGTDGKEHTNQIQAVWVAQNNTFTMNGGTITGKGTKGTEEIQINGVCVLANSTFKMNDGSISSDTGFGVSAQGNNSTTNSNYGANSKIEINGGSITSESSPAIYAPAVDGNLTITGGTITGDSGVEIRAGELNVTGGTIKATGDPYTSDPNGNGSTSSGAGIAIPQHTTAKEIKVNISGNNTQISGANALAVANPQDNDASSGTVGEVSATISGGTLKSTTTSSSATSGNAILSNNANVKLTVLDGTLDGNVTVTKDKVGENESSAQTTLKMQGGTTTGKVQVVKVTRATAGGEITDTETDTTTTAKEALQVTGGTYSDKTSASKYTTSDVKVNEQTGEVVNAGAGWTARGSDNAYDYLVKSGGASATLLSATIGSDSASSLSSLKADAANYLIGVYEGATTAEGNAANSIKSQYYFSTFKTEGNAITLTPQTAGFKIKGTTFIGDVTELTANGSTGINVDATNNKLTNITGGAGNDNLLAGDRNTTLDGGEGDNVLQGGTGNDSLKGGTGKDEFIYTAGNDTVSGFNTGDLVRTTLTAVTDGSKLTTVMGGFKLDFGNSNTLTFTEAEVPVSLSDGSSQYIYTQDLIKQGSSVTLAAGVTNFDVSTQSSLASIMAIDGSAVTGDLTITDNTNNNSITFGKGKNTLNYIAGNDVITGYDDSDVVNLTGDLTAPTDFNNANFDGSDFKITLGSGNSLTFTGKSNVALLKGNDTYTYKGHSNGGLDYIAQEGKGISLGAGHTSTQYNGTSTEYETINASAVTQTIRIRGNDKNNYIVGNTHGGELLGYEGVDTITAGGGSTTLDGGAGNDLLIGSTGGSNQFVYSEGSDSIQNYQAGVDIIKVSGREVSFAEATVETANTNDLLIKFDDANQLSIAGGATDGTVISVTSGRNNYTFTKDYMALEGKGITLAAGYSSLVDEEGSKINTYDGSQSDYVTINAAAVNTAISVMGNSLNNYIFGPTAAASATLNGGSGNDRIDVSERSTTDDGVKYVFEHDAGKDEVFGFNQSNDSLKIAVESITAAKVGNSRLTLTIAKDNSVVLRGDDDITKVNLNEGNATADYLTKDGYVKGNSLKLFSSAKGRIELGDDPYKDTTISEVVADSVKSQSVTLVATQGGTFTYAKDNKKRDGFVYGGGNVKIVNYEAGKDRIDLNAATHSSFTVNDSTKDVVLAVGTGSISITGAAGQEVLLRNGGSRSFKKMVFAQTGVLQNKSKNPTSATVSGAATGYSAAADGKTSVKKIYVEGITTANGIQISAGNKNNTIIDASKAEKGVTLSGGNKNDKLIGNTVSSAADTFIYGAGKDIIQNFSANDTISMATFNASVGSAKITAGSKSIKFKFSNKNTLTVKATKGESLSGALNINKTTNTYAKNAIADSTNNKVTLTDKFSGTFKTVGTKGLDGITVETVDGSKVTKNLTFKGSEAGETLEGGSKKNTFKGGGGNDSLKGGDGKDIFFYAKGDKGTTTIANFEFGSNKDKLKIASGTIGEIKKDGSNIQFAMNSGKKGDTSNIAWFNVETTNATSGKDIAIKANNTYYWFATDEDVTTASEQELTITQGQLITSDTRVSSGDVSNFDILELNYSTNLAKSGVAVKVTGATPNKTNS